MLIDKLIAVASVIVLPLALVVVLRDISQSQPKLADVCMVNDDMREKVRGHMLIGLENSMDDQIKNLFMVRMRDPHNSRVPMLTGLNLTISRYQSAFTEITEWKPPLCNP